MNREILFRGIAAVNQKAYAVKAGDFVYGQFIQSGIDAPCIIHGDGEQVEIKPETLGQYTVLVDSSGKAIFEGDVVYIAGVGDFEVEWPYLGLFEANFEGDIGEVKGNIHENPELLEVKS